MVRVATHTTDTFLFISRTTNVFLFKFLCNIFIGVRIIKEMPGSVASATLCIIRRRSEPCSGRGFLLLLFLHAPLLPIFLLIQFA
jgi:hypothetical protein